MPFGVGSALYSVATWPLRTAIGKLTSTQLGEEHSEVKNARKMAPMQILAADDELLVDAPHADERLFAALLTHFEKPGMSPPSARIRAVVLAEQRQADHTILSSRVVRLGAALASKATELALDAVTHHIWGPRKESWGLRMTLLSAVMRGVNQHSGLVDIATIRLFLSLGNLAPLPHAAQITPFTFRVRQRGLRGILAEHDAAEDGSREIAGEWVDAREEGAADEERVILYLHGGAYYLFSPATHRRITVPLSRSTGARVFSVDYRLAPETRFPGPLHDAVSAYTRLITDLAVPPSRILVAGDSAGGGLALALLLYLRDTELPLPGGAILLSPWVDLTLSCDSWEHNAPFDIVPRPIPGDVLDPIACYLGEEHAPGALLTHPYASPLFGAFDGLPPLLIQSGEAEVLRDECALLAQKARAAGVDVKLEVYPDQVHVFQAFSFLPAAARAFSAAGRWTNSVIPSTTSTIEPALPPAGTIGREDSIESDCTLVGSDADDKEVPALPIPSPRSIRLPRLTRKMSEGPPHSRSIHGIPSRKGTSYTDVAALWALTATGTADSSTRTAGLRRSISSPHAFMAPYNIWS